MAKEDAFAHRATDQSVNVQAMERSSSSVRPEELLSHIVLTSTYLPYRMGGIEKIQHELSRGLSLLPGHSVLVVSLEYGTNEGDIKYDNYDGILIVRIPAPKYSPYVLVDLSETVLGVLQSISSKKSSPLILHVHDWFLCDVAQKFKMQSSCVVFGYFHLCKKSEHPKLQGKFRKYIHAQQKLLAKISDEIFCYSDFMAECISKSLTVPRELITVFPCGVDHQLAISYPLVRSSSFKILYIGRLAEEKCVETLLEAFAQLSVRSTTSTKLIIRGNGSEETSLRNFVRNHKVQNVEFRQWTNDQAEIEAQYAEADCLVLPSRFEPFGMVLLEAIGRGIPVITTNIGGPAEIVQSEKEGWRVTPKSARELLTALEECIASPQDAAKRARKARMQVKRRYNWTIAHNIIADRVYASILLKSRKCAVGGAT